MAGSANKPVIISAETRRIIHEHVIDLSRRLARTEIRLREALAHNLRLSRENTELRRRIAELEKEPAQCA